LEPHTSPFTTLFTVSTLFGRQPSIHGSGVPISHCLAVISAFLS
jgi:hypothetical protein